MSNLLLSFNTQFASSPATWSHELLLMHQFNKVCRDMSPLQRLVLNLLTDCRIELNQHISDEQFFLSVML